MRNSKKFIVMFGLLFFAFVLRFSCVTEEYGEVERFQEARLEPAIWNPMIAETVNDKKLSILVDHKELTNQKDDIYMDDDLNLMIPFSVVGESFHCGTHLYHQKELVLEKRSDVAVFQIDQEQSSVISKQGDYYVSIEMIAKELGYQYDWNIKKNQATMIDQAGETSILPLKYDLRDRQRAPKVKNQGPFGTCWAFAALSAMESTLLPEEEQEFSSDHMALQNSFAIEQAFGGEYTMGMAYLTAWQGPVKEQDDPYGDGHSPENLTPVKHVQEVQIMDGKDFEQIKEAVFRYGGVQTSIYSGLNNAQSYSPYYNSDQSAYCYIGAEKPNHEILIIGWDDNFSGENFNMEVEGNGAFICQNSWGEEFGDNGVFYVSYYDVNVGAHSVVYTRIEDVDNYDYIYQSDLCGWVGQIGYNQDSAYGANVYTEKSEENVQAAGFYATGKETSYELFVVKNFKDASSLRKRTRVAEGVLSNAGFYTIAFEQEISVQKGEKFAVILYLSTPGSVHPLAVEYVADQFTENVTLEDGQGYISAGGQNWESTEEKQNCNVCLKVYSDQKK